VDVEHNFQTTLIGLNNEVFHRLTSVILTQWLVVLQNATRTLWIGWIQGLRNNWETNDVDARCSDLVHGLLDSTIMVIGPEHVTNV